MTHPAEPPPTEHQPAAPLSNGHPSAGHPPATHPPATHPSGGQRPSGQRPVVHLLVGLPGSGKTTYARSLGVVRLSVDDRMVARHGRLDKDYPAAEHLALLGPVVEEVRAELVGHVRAGRSVVLDHGLGRRAERDEYKRLVVAAGGTWRLVHFAVPHDELLRRLTARNEDPAVGRITPDVLAWIADRSEEPAGDEFA